MTRSHLIAAGVALAATLAACDNKHSSFPVGPTNPIATQQLTGTVTEPVGIPLESVLVSVADGPFKGKGAQTDAAGHFLIPSVEGELTLSFYKPDYSSTTRRVNVADNVSLNIEISPVVAPLDVSGAWKVRFERSPHCGREVLPEWYSYTDYKATITQRGASLEIALSEGGLDAPVAVYGVIRATNVSTNLPLGCDYYCTAPSPSVVSRLADGRYVVVAGAVSATVRNGGMDGVLDGVINLQTSAEWPWEMLGSCQDPEHRVTFTR